MGSPVSTGGMSRISKRACRCPPVPYLRFRAHKGWNTL